MPLTPSTTARERDNIPPVPPGSVIGILGGGQLGRMLSLAAARMGYACHIYTPDHDSPASTVSAMTTVAPWDSRDHLAAFADRVDVITLEFENIPLDCLDFLSQRTRVHPARPVLETAQDRIKEKTFFSAFAQTAPWAPVFSENDLIHAVEVTGTPAILKTNRLGYDGKGQVRVETQAELAKAWDTLKTDCAILEGFVAFRGEASILIARGRNGETASWDLAWNKHRNHILDTSSVPAPVSKIVAAEALRIACEAAKRLDLTGLLALEFFVTHDDRILVNEMAPRPHNSGHWTMDGSYTDQFEQALRAVCGLPLGDTRRRCAVTMKNLLGHDVANWPMILENPLARLHLYGKASPRPGRKMGHINFLEG
ncbi:5-(carboxyamino)imidazole ribonucleotide synthase [Haematospirillum sp. H1815]|uniref:5-(carboxyamino)imidazole ribonucleotide synthase n=1 Tax=Haematospirillum sp. H1815 TaxID=2723108 RepID=UPI00143AB663|nr:5-(carboxyamino)imidazole ribonucleotide synthase [Haematospirillum sp. H1815]NKD76312.1 5-(carboxyamino)imidazole ribonucleotide synthase [Haematospirillum sp. H1815]